MENRKQILVVDDAAISLLAIERTLKDHYDIISMNSGARALRYLKDEKPDLILLDICMANMNGIETLRSIRKMENGKNVPVIMLTSSQDKDSVLETYKLGIVDYVSKPFDQENLRERVGSVFDTAPKTEPHKSVRRYY